MVVPVNKTKKQYESGHAKNLESLGKLIASSETFDQTILNPPSLLKISALMAMRATATALLQAVGNLRADWRTVALARAVYIDTFESIASQAVGQLAGRGASKETVRDARGYLRKLRGKSLTVKKTDDPATPEIDESVKGISKSQQSNAAKIATFYELIDFLEAQPEYANVTKAGLTIADLRALVDAAQAKHDVSITAAAQLSAKRDERNKFFYLTPKINIIDIALQFKELVKGSFGGVGSTEYKSVKGIRFRRPKL